MSNDIQALIFFLLLALIGIFLLWFFIFKVKHLKIPQVYLVTGGVKTGKSFVSVWLAVRQYKRNLRKVKIINFLIKRLLNPVRHFLNKCVRRHKPKAPFKLREIPMLYSNMHLRNIKYNLLTMDIIFRRVRIPVGSVALLDEVSLFADSMLCLTKDYKEKNYHESLMLMIKLWGHYCGGYMIVNTQSLADCSYEIKRCISSYLWIQSKRKFPFFTLLQVRELAHSEDNDIVNNFDKDTEVDNRPLFILNKYMKYYDYRCYSVFTDGLNLQVDYDNPVKRKGDSLKTHVLLTLQDFKTLKDFSSKYVEEQAQKKVSEVHNNAKA